jgi:hypothetical protein
MLSLMVCNFRFVILGFKSKNNFFNNKDMYYIKNGTRGTLPIIVG